LLYTLDKKVSTIPNFQRTRGSLRLLALAVRLFCGKHAAESYAFHPYHLDLSNSQITEDLTARLDRPLFMQVIDADIASELEASKAHAQEIDADYPRPYAQRLATTIFLHSLTQGIATGINPSELNVAVLTPSPSGGDNPAVVDRALERLDNVAWFMEYDGHRYRFKTEISPKKMVDEEMGQVGPTKGKAEVDSRIKRIWKCGNFNTLYFPDAPSEVDDDAPKLIIMHYDAVTSGVGDSTPPELLMRMMRYKGTDDSCRVYQNRMYLVADKDHVDNMADQCRRYLAINRILDDPDQISVFNDE